MATVTGTKRHLVIESDTLNTGQGANELYDMDQNVLTTSDVTFATISATSLNVTSITSSIVTSSILKTEGSNIFGDASNDTHTFNGNITVTGTVDGRDIATDGTKLDGIASSANNYSLPLASSTRGGVKIGYTENGKNYPVELSSEKMFVNVPWTDNNDNTQLSTEQVQDIVGTMFSSNTETRVAATYDDTSGKIDIVVDDMTADTNTTYSVGDGGLTQKNFTTTLKNKLDGIATSANNYSLPTAAANTLGGIKVGTNLSIDSNGILSSTDTNTTYSVGDGGLTQKNFTTTLKNKLDGIASSANNYSLPLASGTRGGVKIGYSENGKNYPVELSSEKMYVNVPWTDTNTTYSVGDGGLTQKNFTTTLKTKLDGISTSADVTDATTVAAAGALMDSEVTNLAEVKAFDSSDYATTAQGTKANTAHGWGNHASAGYGTSNLALGTTSTTAKAGNTTTISTSQASAITANTAKTGITSTQAGHITANNAKTGISTSQASAITANTAKTGITSTQANAITANTAKTGITSTQASRIVTNTAKTGITSTQASQITANNAKVGTETDLSITEGMNLLASVTEDRGTYTLTFTVTHGRVTKTAEIRMS